MDAYRTQIRGRMRWMIACSAILVVVVAGFWYSFTNDLGETFADGFVNGVQVGLFLAMLLFAVLGVVQCARALRSDDALERMRIAETDERARFIRDKIGGVGLDISLGILCTATIVAGFFNMTVFFTLLASLAVIVFVKAGLKLYFGHKF